MRARECACLFCIFVSSFSYLSFSLKSFCFIASSFVICLFTTLKSPVTFYLYLMFNCVYFVPLQTSVEQGPDYLSHHRGCPLQFTTLRVKEENGDLSFH